MLSPINAWVIQTKTMAALTYGEYKLDAVRQTAQFGVKFTEQGRPTRGLGYFSTT